jgi:hypothetical protein
MLVIAVALVTVRQVVERGIVAVERDPSPIPAGLKRARRMALPRKRPYVLPFLRENAARDARKECHDGPAT